MKVKNIGGKIVNIGSDVILPGETKPVPDSYAGNAALNCLVEHENVELIQGTDAVKQPPVQEEPPAGAEKPDEEKDESGDGKKPLSRMNKAELVEECQRLGIEVSPDDTNPTLVEKIKAASAE